MTKTNTVEADELVQKFLKKEDQKTLDKIVSGIEKVVKHTPAIYDKDKLREYLTRRADLLKKLVEEYINALISQVLPRISDELFELKRNLLIKKEEGLQIIKDFAESIQTKEEKQKIENKEYYEAEIPLFIYTGALKANQKVELAKFKTIEKRSYYDSYYGGKKQRKVEVNKTIDANFNTTKQNTIKENYEKTIEALSIYYTKLKEAYKNPIIKELLTQTKLEHPETGIIWTPSVDELSIKADPKIAKTKSKLSDTIMLVLDFKQKQYLITTLKTKEDSVDKYLKELTVDVKK